MTLKTAYKTEIAKAFGSELGVANVHAIPKIVKVVVNVGIPAQNREPKTLETVEKVLRQITGQKPAPTLARQSISNFKIRKGMVVGYMVTLRGSRMYDFVERLLKITLPRVRDFRGFPERVVDARGNASIGFKEQTPFSELKPELLDRTHGIEVTIVTDAASRERGLALLRAIGFPFYNL